MEVIISPSKNLYINPDAITAAADRPFVQQFNQNSVSGLLHLAKSVEMRRRSASTLYWYEFSSEVLKHYCTIKENSDLAVEPDHDTVKKYLNYCPEMLGREYLDEDLLVSLWEQINQSISADLSNFKGPFRQFVEKHYPDWAQVGRINFHLAETNKNPDLPFAFLATYATRVSDNARTQHIPLGRIISEFAEREKKDLLLSILSPIKEVASHSDFLNQLITSKRIYQTSYFSSLEAYSFLNSVGNCEKAGIVVKLPQAWQGRAPARVKVSVKVGSNTNKGSFVGFANLFRFHVNVTVAGEVLSEKEIKALLSQNQTLTQIRGKWVEIDKDKIQNLLQKWQKASYLRSEGFTFTQAMRMLSGSKITKQDTEVLETEADAASWLEFTGSKQLQDVLKGMLNPSSLVSQELQDILPKKLNASLRPYQEDGVKWLRFLSKLGLGGCLADDMGLGKTIQVISLLLLEKEANAEQPSLLVVPASLLGNWEGELKKFSPSLKVKILHRSQCSKNEIQDFSQHFATVDLVITSYALAKRIEWLREKSWNILIIDEAQAIKNPSAQQTKTIKSLNSRVKIALTGTPIENNLSDLWSLFDFSCPSLLGSYGEFKKFQKNLLDSGSYDSLRKLVQPYIIRRKKTDKSIIADLPDKTELKTYCLLTKDQIKLYKKTIKELADTLNSDETSEMKRKGLILSYLLKFKQICNHPSQFFSDNIYDYEKSGKFYRLKELAETIASRGEKVLVFTQFREVTDILCSFLAEVFGRKGFVLHGATPVKKRSAMVEEFQKEASAPYFVLSIKAGGTGLNLTKASHVIHFDRWWNPAVENQATDRAFRIGQKKNVVVHKFICRGTIEEKIDLMIEDKKGLANDVLEGKQEIKLTELSNEEILNLVSLDIKSAEFYE